MESLKIEITSTSLKVEERQAVGSLKIERLDQSVEYPEVEDKEFPKVEHDESPTTEENKESHKTEDNKNSEVLEIGRGDLQCAPKPIQSENIPGFNLRVNYEEKPLKVEVKNELMDVDYADLTQMELELGPSAGKVEEIGLDCGVASTPPPDDATRVAFLHGSERHPTPPPDLGSDDDVRMDAEDHVSSEAAARTMDEISTVGRAASVPRQLVIQDEHTEMDIDSVSNTTDKARPEKRRRMRMDYVFAPFDRVARAQTDNERRALDKRMEQLRNPKVKMSKDAPVLSLDTVRVRLRTHGISYEPFPIDLEPDIRDVAVRRDFMTQEYGGNSRDTYPKIGAKFADKTQMRDFMYLNLNYNPQCPQIPGAPGLRFGVTYRKDLAVDLSTSDDEEQDEDGVKAATGKSKKRETKKGRKTKGKKGKGAKGKKVKDADDEEDDDKTVRDKARAKEEAKIRMLFARLDKNQWQYQGQYALKPAVPLTVEEWKEQPLQVRRTWAQRLSVRGWGRWLRADITLRRQLGRTPTEAEKKAALKDKNDKFLTVTPEEIGKLLDSGEVVIRVSTMRCVGYNADFQRVLAEKMPLFVPKPQPKKNGATSKPKRSRKTPATKRRAASVSLGQKRKRQEESDDDSKDSEEDSDDVSESEDEDWGPKEKVYQHRGTRSRSIVL